MILDQLFIKTLVSITLVDSNSSLNISSNAGIAPTSDSILTLGVVKPFYQRVTFGTPISVAEFFCELLNLYDITLGENKCQNF
jgi:hypothetical protein